MHFEFPRRSVRVETIVNGLWDLSIRAGDTVLVHSSLSRFGEVNGGAETVIRALLQAVGEEGTILAPTLTGTREDGPTHPPRFNVRTTPCWTGRVAETLRLWPGAIRSLGPTHSVTALGSDARRLLAGHEDCRTPCGAASPYVKLAKAGGKIIFFGVTLDANTTFHAAEELACVPYHLQQESTPCLIIDETGRELKRDCLLHYWNHKRRFHELEEVLFGKGILKRGLVGPVHTLIVESAPMMEFTLGILKRDPWYLVETRELSMIKRIMRKVEYFMPVTK